MNHEQYVHSEEGLRVVDTGKSKLKIVHDKQTGLWDIQTEQGPLPVALRDKKFTSHRYGYQAIKNYLDGHAERSVIYKVNKKEV